MPGSNQDFEVLIDIPGLTLVIAILSEFGDVRWPPDGGADSGSVDAQD